MEWSSSQVSKSVSLSHPTLTVHNTKSNTNTLNINIDSFAPKGWGLNKRLEPEVGQRRGPYLLVFTKDQIEGKLEELKGRTGDRWGAPEWRRKN